MAGNESVSIRLSLKDGDTVRRALLGLGDEGQEALARIEDSAQSSGEALTGLGDTASSVVEILGAIGVGFSVAEIASGIAEVSARFQDMRSALKVATGSAQAADDAFENLRMFARETPFQLSEVTEAFIRLKNLGLDPSNAALTAYGDIASSFDGKTVMDFIEAVADAATGEFERLKEFGIRASAQGDQVAFTFRGVTTEIGKNADEIEEYLQNLASANFGGAMAEKMQNISGQVSNLKDAIDNLYATIGEGGAVEVMTAALGLATDAVNGLTENLSTLVDVIALVGSVAAGRLLGPMVVSMGRAAVAARLAALENIRYQATLASMAGVSRTAAIGMTAFAGATRLATGALALLGGPVGLAITALSGAVYLLSTRQDEAEEATELHRDALEKLNTVLKKGNGLSETAAKNARDAAKARLDEAKAANEQALASVRAQMARLKEQKRLLERSSPASPMIDGLNAELTDLSFDLVAAKQRVDELNEAYRKLKDIKKDSDDEDDDGSNDTKSDPDKVAAVIERLKSQQAQLTRTSREQAIYNAFQEAGIKDGDEAAEKIREVAGAYYDAQQAIAELNEKAKAEDDARAKIDDNIAALARENALLRVQGVEREKLRAILEAEAIARKGGIALSDAQRAQIEKQVGDLERLRKAENEAAEAARDARQFSRDFGSVIGRSFEDAIISGEKFSDVLKSLEQDIARIILRMSVTKPLENAISGFNWGGLFSSIGSSLFGGSSGASVDYTSKDYDWSQVGKKHSGGMVGVPGQSKAVSAAVFDGAPRLHGGGSVGLAHGERPIIALDDERVLTKAQQQNTAETLRALARMAGSAEGDKPSESVTYAPVISVDARGSTMTAAELRAIVDQSVNQSVAKVRDLQRRKGSAKI